MHVRNGMSHGSQKYSKLEGDLFGKRVPTGREALNLHICVYMSRVECGWRLRHLLRGYEGVIKQVISRGL